MLPAGDSNPADVIAVAIETARVLLAGNKTPPDTLCDRFVEALSHMIRDALHDEQGDPAFQAMVLQHTTPDVQKHVLLAASADHDRRALHAVVNTIAHPARQQRAASEPQRKALAKLHTAALSPSSWAEFSATAQRILALPVIANEPQISSRLERLLESDSLQRLISAEALEPTASVQQYLALRERMGPLSGSVDAIQQGFASERRGAAVEAKAAQALSTLAGLLNRAASSADAYRAVTSLRVPASMPGNPHRAKTEWDAVLLQKHERSTPGGDETELASEPATWNIFLLVEAKASPDATATDFPRLLRGLRLLAHADKDTTYVFESRQGTVPISGLSLNGLSTDKAAVPTSVLYCCDAPADFTPRLLSAAGRMRLLSDPASLAYAQALLEQQAASSKILKPIWQQLLTEPAWQPVLHQYATLHQANELMVHADDFLAALNLPISSD